MSLVLGRNEVEEKKAQGVSDLECYIMMRNEVYFMQCNAMQSCAMK